MSLTAGSASVGSIPVATARLADKAEEPGAYAALRANYRWLDRLYESTADHLPVESAYVEIICAVGKEDRS